MDRQKQYIRAWRKHRNLTQTELAEKSGVDETQISRLETGKRDYNQTTLEAIARALNCDPGDLLKHDPEGQQQLEAVWSGLTDDEQRQLLAHAQVIRESRKKVP